MKIRIKILIFSIFLGLIGCEKEPSDVIIVPNGYCVDLTIQVYGNESFNLEWYRSDINNQWRIINCVDSFKNIWYLEPFDTLKIKSYGNRLIAHFDNVLYMDTTHIECLNITFPLTNN